MEVLDHASRFIRDNTAADKPWFCWFNTTRMHVWTHLKEESQGVTGLGVYPDGMVEHDGHIGQMLNLLDELGITNDAVVYTTDNGAEVMSWPDGARQSSAARRTRRGKNRIPLFIRFPRAIKPGTVSNGIVSLEDFVPTLVVSPASRRSRRSCCSYAAGDRTYKVHLDGYNFVPFSRSEWPRRELLLYRRQRRPGGTTREPVEGPVPRAAGGGL